MDSVFRNRRINDCPERTQDLFNLDFSGYEVQRIDAGELTDGNREEASRMLEIGERTLYRKIKEYELRK